MAGGETAERITRPKVMDTMLASVVAVMLLSVRIPFSKNVPIVTTEIATTIMNTIVAIISSIKVKPDSREPAEPASTASPALCGYLDPADLLR
jgi:hypothetical protein